MTLLEALLNPRFVTVLLWILALGTPAVGVAAAILAGRPGPALGFQPPSTTPAERRAALLRMPLFWVLSAGGPLICVLWRLFNAIENRLGLDSIPAMLINIALFCLTGIGLSFFLRHGHRWLRPRAPRPESKHRNGTPAK